jgi:hypothetical protein
MLVRQYLPVEEELSYLGPEMAHDLIGTPALSLEGEVVGMIKAAWYDPYKHHIAYESDVIELPDEEPRRVKRRRKRKNDYY